jgi:hypothetical protein
MIDMGALHHSSYPIHAHQRRSTFLEIKYFIISFPKVSLAMDVYGVRHYDNVTTPGGRQNQSAVVSNFRSIILAP